MNPSRLRETRYRTTLAREFNQIEPENVMKFGPIHPQRDRYDFKAADEVVRFARANQMTVRGHVLVWHMQNPMWLTTGNFRPAQLAAILQGHIGAVLKHYAGNVYAWDVVNEAFNGDGSLRSTIWYDKPGMGLNATGYIEQAFRWAHDEDPNALLFYNDLDAEEMNAKSDAIYAMARDFMMRGVPINGIGMQLHLTREPLSLGSVEANIQRITDLGLQVQFTELDVRLPVDSRGAATPTDLASQAAIYGDIAQMCFKFPRCTAIQTWGFTDKHSWIPRFFGGTGAALIFDVNYRPKPAYYMLQTVFRKPE